MTLASFNTVNVPSAEVGYKRRTFKLKAARFAASLPSQNFAKFLSFSASFLKCKTHRPDFAELITLTAYLTTIHGVQSRYGNFKFQYRERTFGRDADQTKWLTSMRQSARAGRFAASPKIYLLSRVPSTDSKNRGVCFAKLLQWVFRQLWRSCSSFARLWGRDQHQVCSVSEENTRLSHELTYV